MLNMAIGDPRRYFLKLLHKLLHNLQYYSGANYSADLPTGNLLDMHADLQTSCLILQQQQQQQQQQQDRKQNKILNNLQFLHSGSFASKSSHTIAMLTKEFDQTKFDPTSFDSTRIPVLVL
jgi:hypothetical protein